MNLPALQAALGRALPDWKITVGGGSGGGFVQAHKAMAACSQTIRYRSIGNDFDNADFIVWGLGILRTHEEGLRKLPYLDRYCIFRDATDEALSDWRTITAENVAIALIAAFPEKRAEEEKT